MACRQSNSETVKYEGGLRADRLGGVPVELLQGRNQTSGKGQTQSLKVYGYHLQSSARCIDVISQQGKLYRAFPCLQIFACKSMATTCGQLTFQTKSVKVQCLKMYGYFCGQSGHQ